MIRTGMMAMDVPAPAGSNADLPAIAQMEQMEVHLSARPLVVMVLRLCQRLVTMATY